LAGRSPNEELHRRGHDHQSQASAADQREDNLPAIRYRKYILTTDSQHEHGVYVNQSARMTVTAVNQLWGRVRLPGGDHRSFLAQSDRLGTGSHSGGTADGDGSGRPSPTAGHCQVFGGKGVCSLFQPIIASKIMRHVQLTQTDALLAIRMARPKANALNSEVLADLREAVGTAAADSSVRGAVLASAVPGVFSAGFDAREIFPYEAAEIKTFFGAFTEVCHAMLDLPKPLGAAIEGHAMAGGAILALTCDLRVMGEGQYGFALNEINLGLVLSEGIMQMAVAAMGAGAARELFLEGATIGPPRCLAVGLASELVPSGTAFERVEQRVRGLMDKPPVAFAAVKKLFREAMVMPVAREMESLDQFVGYWISAESRERRERLAASLRRQP
jgi:enoyl-CoA hydratase/carnithine racemase